MPVVLRVVIVTEHIDIRYRLAVIQLLLQRGSTVPRPTAIGGQFPVTVIVFTTILHRRRVAILLLAPSILVFQVIMGRVAPAATGETVGEAEAGVMVV